MTTYPKYLAFLFSFLSFFSYMPFLFAIDLTIIGTFDQADGIGRISIGIIDILKDDLNINCIPITKPSFRDVSDQVRKIIANQKTKPRKNPGKVSLLTLFPSWRPQRYYQHVPKSQIKIAYSMFESTRIPLDWVDAFNAHFDAVVVPDPFLVQVYQDSGVKIPIFVLPLGMYLDDFARNKHEIFPHLPFVFGCTCTFIARKNLPTLIQAFKEEFGNNKGVKLCIHGRYEEQGHSINQIDLGVSNIILSKASVGHQEYLNIMKSFDCYVNLSKGEGFSCGPREALAMAIPCIISDNTAHHTLCESGFVEGVPAAIIENATAYRSNYSPAELGFQFNCKVEDVRSAMRKVYNDYSKYHQQALLGSKWVLGYSWRQLKKNYLNLFKPKTVILGDRNEVTDKYFMTNSKGLYEKYLTIQKK